MITDNLTTSVYFSDLLPKKCPTLNQQLVKALDENWIRYAYLSETKDIWCRDFMPIQITEDRFVFYKYTPNYLQHPQYLRLQTNPQEVFHAGANRLEHLLQDAITIDLVLDGGNVVKCGDAIVMTEKVFAENKDKTHAEVERILRDAFQCDIVFLPWDHKETFGHSDGIVHYAGDSKVLLTNYGDSSPYYYRRFLKTLEKHFEVIPLQYEIRRRHANSWAYINFLQIGKLILVSQLGIQEDEQAVEQISNALPGCEVVGIPARESVRRGGALNCISWNVTTLQDDAFAGENDIETNYERACELNASAAKQLKENQIDTDALFDMAFKYENGLGIEQNLQKAIELYTEAAEQGHVYAQHFLALCYEYGRGVEANLSKAFEWYFKAAEHGAPGAQHNVAVCYENGDGVVQNFKKAVEWYTKAANQDFPDSQYNLAICYEEGKGVRKDLTKAFEWYAKAAKKGEVLAQYKLAECYRKGKGVEKDLAKAVTWFKKAANQDDPLAQNDLGACYANGDGVEKDLKKAVRWYKKAAAQDEETAQYNLAVCYEKGHGVEKNLEKAVAWYTISASHGYKRAKDKLLALQKKKN